MKALRESWYKRWKESGMSEKLVMELPLIQSLPLSLGALQEHPDLAERHLATVIDSYFQDIDELARADMGEKKEISTHEGHE